jgi:BirA family biotin operon repressor/biotin-[acetyl-CoA-carboxylase] ligase
MIPLNADVLNDPDLPWNVTVLDEVGSTSDWLRERAASVQPGTVVFAEAQTAGRGRRDNRWITPRGKDLMFSLLLQPPAPVEKWPRITTLAALAVCKAVEEELPLTPRIKWPNDIYLEDRKLSGLLAETVSAARGLALVLGIGLNVNTIEFPPHLPATSLLARMPGATVREVDRNSLACRLLRALHGEFLRLEDDFSAAVAEVRERSWLFGKQVRASIQGNETFGRVIDLDEEGRLILELPDGALQVLASAENIRPM